MLTVFGSIALDTTRTPFQTKERILGGAATYASLSGSFFVPVSLIGIVGHADIIGMTLVPECVLARESEICYLSISTITDYDVWAEQPVSTKEIIETLHKNVEITRTLISKLVPLISDNRNDCICGSALDNALL